jgi:hypothetical protein
VNACHTDLGEFKMNGSYQSVQESHTVWTFKKINESRGGIYLLLTFESILLIITDSVDFYFA